MNEQEAVDICEDNEFDINWNNDNGIVFRAFVKRALENIKKYRAIGSVEECRAAVEKQTASPPPI